MPHVLADPTFRPGIITNGGTDLFSYPNTQAPSVLSLQTDTAQPLPPGTATAANLLNPDLHLEPQVRNFPGSIYDLSPSSVLMHFMGALLGNAGAGQLRRRQMIARLQQAVTSTRFYDLDAFYGALFGAQRGAAGALPTNPATGQPFDPYSDLATQDGWDEIEAIDAKFRERVIALARAITLGGTVPGLRALAEAVTGVPCSVYEVWRLVTNPLAPAPGYNTWSQVVVSYPQWSSFPATATWQSVEGVVTYSGLMGNGAINEVVIRPHKSYTSSEADLAEKGSDTFGILRVAEVLRPAAALVSVDLDGPGLVTEVPVSAAWSGSEFQEFVHLVTPFSSADPCYAKARAAYGKGGVPLGGTFPQPCPPLSRSQGNTYSYVSDVTTVTAAAVSGDDPNAAVVTSGQDFQTVVWHYSNPRDPDPHGGRFDKDDPHGPSDDILYKTLSYLPPQALMPAPKAATRRTASAVAVMSAPYSGPRVPVKRSS